MFLTLEDPNAKIKGSRDPLGVQPVWSAFARHVVTNLTSVTGSLRGFTVLLLGRYLVEQAIDDGQLPRESALEGFLRFEQIAAYARHVGHGVDSDIRGIERVKRNVDEGRGRVTIGTNRDGYILGDQKVYGLWGLFSVSARVSGLITDGPVGVQERTRAFIESEYRPRLDPVWKPLQRLVARGGMLATRGRDPVLEAVASVLPEELSRHEAWFYGESLRDAQHVESASPGRQGFFAALLRRYGNLDGSINREEVLSLAEWAREGDAELARRLKRIATLESLLAPSATLFDYILTRHGQKLGDVAAGLTDRWGRGVPNLDPAAFDDLVPEIAHAATEEFALHCKQCAGALAAGAYEDAVRTLLDLNAAVMRGRQGAPWARMESGRIDVRYRGSEQLLPDAEAMGALWRNGYFIESLKRITNKVGNGAQG
jgi:hypothetical protein